VLKNAGFLIGAKQLCCLCG